MPHQSNHHQITKCKDHQFPAKVSQSSVIENTFFQILLASLAIRLDTTLFVSSTGKKIAADFASQPDIAGKCFSACRLTRKAEETVQIPISYNAHHHPI